jgi:hypothetical protein
LRSASSRLVERVLGHQPAGLVKVYQLGQFDDAAADARRR